MGGLLNINNVNIWKDKLNNIKFSKKKLVIITDDKDRIEFMFIVLENKTNNKYKVTGYSQYFFEELLNKRLETIDFHAKIIVSFLNYIFIEKYEDYKMVNIRDLKIEYGNDYLRDYSKGLIGKKKKTKKTVIKIEEILNRFYIFLYQECKDMKYLDDDVIDNIKVEKQSYYWKRANRKTKSNSLFKVIYPTYKPPMRIKSMTIYLLSEILKTYDIYYPELKLGVCMQAFGGLRIGDICNATKDCISLSKMIDEYSWFTIDLSKKVQVRGDGIDVGNIKINRIQPIHPVFLSVFSKIYDNHLDLIKNIHNTDGALFLNRDGNAITDGSYYKKFKRVINLTIKRLSQKGDFNASNEVNTLMSGLIGTHICRYFFTQFIASLESTRNPIEIAYWRGDSSLESALVYMMGSPVIDDKIKIMQDEFIKDLGYDI